MNRKSIFTLIIVITVITPIVLFWPNIKQGLQLFSNLQAITNLVRQSGAWGPLALIVLLILQVFLAFIPGQVLMAASGYIFGFWGGTLVTWIGLVLGGQMAFWLARRYGRPFAVRFVTPDVLDRWDRLVAKQGIGFYVVTLLLPFFPNDAMCYVAGLSEIHPRRFTIANLLGRFLATTAMTFVGAYGSQIPLGIWIAAGIAIGLATLLWHAHRKGFRFPLNIKKGGTKCQAAR